MKPATNMVELVRNLAPARLLTQADKEFYVPIYSDVLRKLRYQLVVSQSKKETYYTSGQSGTGKTTALNFLPNTNLEDQFAVHFLYGNELFDLSDVDIIDVLLMICYELIKGKPKLENQFTESLNRIRDKNEGILEETTVVDDGSTTSGGASLNLGLGNSPISSFFKLFKVGADFFTSLKLDKKYRQITRRAFAFQKQDLLALTNEIIESYLLEVAPGKELLLIFNELDHIKQPQLITELFITNRYLFEELRCKKVISVPVMLLAEERFTRPIDFFGLKLTPNPLIDELTPENKERIDDNKDHLRKIIQKRIAEDQELITEEAIDYAINKSGGIIRQFISIVHNAAVKVGLTGANRISLNDVEEGASTFRQILERSIISQEKIAILEQVRTENRPNAQDEEAFIEALLGNQILIYQNNPN
ncbi:MAG: hypothetical protein AAGH79_16330 [Bacteroidota bacterium]